MSKLSYLDMAWDQVVAARAQSDASAEAWALSLLEQALYDVGRSAEAHEIGTQVIGLRCHSGSRDVLQPRFEMWMRRGEQLEEQAAVSGSFYPRGGDLHLLMAAHDAYFHALKPSMRSRMHLGR